MTRVGVPPADDAAEILRDWRKVGGIFGALVFLAAGCFAFALLTGCTAIDIARECAQRGLGCQ